jgi:hypothetical protein
MSAMLDRLRYAANFTPAARATYLCARRHGFSNLAAHAIARVCLTVERSGRSGSLAYDRCHQIIRKTRAAEAITAPPPAPVLVRPLRLPINTLSATERTLLSHYRLSCFEDRRHVRRWLANASGATQSATLNA